MTNRAGKKTAIAKLLPTASLIPLFSLFTPCQANAASFSFELIQTYEYGAGYNIPDNPILGTGGLSFDDSSITGIGAEAVSISNLDNSSLAFNFFSFDTEDAEESYANQRQIGKYGGQFPYDVTFDPIFYFEDGVLTGIDLSVGGIGGWRAGIYPFHNPFIKVALQGNTWFHQSKGIIGYAGVVAFNTVEPWSERSSESVPEPSLLWGLLAFGFLKIRKRGKSHTFSNASPTMES